MKNCIFCQMVQNQRDIAKICEDKDFIAVLDINPNVKGMTLVISKKHYNSYVFDMPEDEYLKFMKASKKVARILEKSLNVKRVAMVMEGLGINHAHIKLYPLHGLDEKFAEMWAKERIFFSKYEGYISTKLGPEVNIQQLKQLAEEMKKYRR